MKLELKHFSSYLPYKLKLMQDRSSWHDPTPDGIVTFKGILDKDDYYTERYGKDFPDITTIWYEYKDEKSKNPVHGNDYLSRFTPILRPLSDLVKEITCNNETFIPALKLSELKVTLGLYKDKAIYESFDYKIIQKPFGKVLKTTKLDDWIIYLSLSEIHRAQHWIVEKLLEWNFDIFQLIDKGLAIDINTLENYEI